MLPGIDAMHAFFEALRVRSQVGGNPTRGAARQLIEARLSSVAASATAPRQTSVKSSGCCRRSTEFLSRNSHAS